MSLKSESSYRCERVNSYGEKLVNLIMETKYETKHEIAVDEFMFPESDVEKVIKVLKEIKD